MKHSFLVLSSFVFLSVFGQASSLPSGAQPILIHGDSRVGTYVSSKPGFETASYWIEGSSGLIFIDTQFLFSAAEEALNWAESVTGKKVKLAIVLHPNPDKFNGTSIFQKRGIEVVSSDQVISLIPEVHKDRHHWFYERFKPDYPDTAPQLKSFGKATATLSAGGVSVQAHVLGAGCSGAHVVVEFDKHVFVGDLVTNGNHSWIELGQIDPWLKRLEEIRKLDPEYVHIGRGPSGGPELLDREEAYLKTVLKLVREAHPKMPVNDKAIERIQNKLLALYPGYGYDHFVEIGLPSVWEEEVKKAGKSK